MHPQACLGRDKEVKIDLDDEPESLLDSLNTWREKVAVGEFPEIPGLSRLVKPTLLNFLISQLDRELISHNMIVVGLPKGWMGSSREHELL